MNAILLSAGLRPAFAALLLLQTGQLQIPPAPRGFGDSAAEVVRDQAGVLAIESIDRINRIAFDVHRQAKGEIALVTLADIGQRDPIDVGVAIARAWKLGAESAIGARDRNAGVLILLVPKETSTTGRGRCRILTGQGTEGFITDAESGDMCREAVPLLQQRDYSGAAELLARRVAEKFAQEFGFALDTSLGPTPAREVATPRAGRGGGFPPQLIFLLIVFILASLSGGRGRRRGCIPIFIPFGGGGWGGGSGWSSGGGFGGGGGGGFGGFGGGGGFSGGGGGSDW